MRRMKNVVVTLCTVFLMFIAFVAYCAYGLSARADGPGARGQGKPTVGVAQLPYKPGEVLVKFEDNASKKTMSSLTATAGAAKTLKKLGPEDGRDIHLLKLRSDVSVEHAVGALNSHDEVLYAEPNYISKASYNPTDRNLPDQWGLHNTGQTIEGQEGTADADIDAPEAWDIEKGESNPVTVAVIDSGIDLSHPDIASKLWVNSGEKPGNNRDDDGNGYIDDTHGYNFAGISQYNFQYISPTDGQMRFSCFYFGTGEATRSYAQSFTSRASEGNSQILSHVGIMLSRVGNPVYGITVSVRESLNGKDLASYTISPEEVNQCPRVEEDNPGEIYKPLSSALSLKPDKTYYLVFTTRNGEHDYSYYFHNYYKLYDNSVDNWVPGSFHIYHEGTEHAHDGYSWKSEWQWDDFYFRTNGYECPHDNNGHGTHCAGVIGAEENDRGVVGVSFGSGTKIMPLKNMDASGSAMSEHTIEAIYYAADNGADVISMSFGGGNFSQAQQDALNYAASKGVVLFAATGNDGNSDMKYPAGCENVIGVGATTNQDQKADFSTYNASVDVSAPGQDIYATMPGYSVKLNEEGCTQTYTFMSGTSMACPMAAGLGALILSRSPSLTPGEVQELMQDTADDLGTAGRDDYFGHGRINACRAISGATASQTWYLAEGTTAWGFDSYISIENPNPEAVTAEVTYMTPDGPTGRPDIALPAGSQTTINPRSDIGDRDFSTQIECKEGKTIAVDRTMSWTGPGAASPDGHCSVGVTSPNETWYLAEGSSAWGFECWLLIQNPNDREATCTVTYMIEGEGPQTFTKKVPANSRRTYNMNDDIGAKDASIKVDADVPVIPERAMYRNDRRGGHDSIGTISPAHDYFLAEGTTAWGFTTYVLVQNPNDQEANVTVTYMTNEGPQTQAPFAMPANSRKTIRVNDVLPERDLSTKVSADVPVIAERAMYWGENTELGEACHDSIGMASSHTTFYLPDGETANGKETWTLVQNPNDCDVEVEITYMTANGEGNVNFTDRVGANSRKTYNMADALPDSRAAIMVTSRTEGKKIMVERALYWNTRGAGTDTIGGYAD